jgi:hypothetical protein
MYETGVKVKFYDNAVSEHKRIKTVDWERGNDNMLCKHNHKI